MAGNSNIRNERCILRDETHLCEFRPMSKAIRGARYKLNEIFKTYKIFYLLFVKKGRSAIISHTNTTISGLCTIHATKSEATLLKEFNSLQDQNTSVTFLFKASTRAIAFWLEFICVLYMTVAIVIFLVFEKGKLEIKLYLTGE